MKRTTLTILLAALVFALGVAPAVQAQETPWPQDARDVTAALMAKVLNVPGPSNIEFAADTVKNIEGAGTDFFAGFTEGGAVPVLYKNVGEGREYEAEIMGVMNLNEPGGRKVGLQFYARYHVANNKIAVNECLVATGSPRQPHLEVYLVPAQTFETGLRKLGDDWNSLHDFVKGHAYRPGREDARQVWYVVTFVMDRLPQGSKFEPVVSKKQTTRFPKDNDVKAEQFFFDYDGWRGHIFATKFKPGGTVDRFFINFYYTPGPDVPEDLRDRVRIGTYNSTL